MKGLTWYYVTRLALVALWLLVAEVAGLPVWLSAPTAVAVAAYFVWLPQSGRYVIRQDRPLAPVRRDERSQAISDRAATWAFVVQTLLAAAGIVWGALLYQQESASSLGLVLAAGMLTYVAARAWLDRTS